MDYAKGYKLHFCVRGEVFVKNKSHFIMTTKKLCFVLNIFSPIEKEGPTDC